MSEQYTSPQEASPQQPSAVERSCGMDAHDDVSLASQAVAWLRDDTLIGACRCAISYLTSKRLALRW